MPIPFLLLGAAVLAVWLAPSTPRAAALRWAWAVLLLLALLAGAHDGHVNVLGVAGVLALVGASTAYVVSAPGHQRTACACLAALMAAALATHRVPGFKPYEIALLGSGTGAGSLRVHLDTTAAGLVLLACFAHRGTTGRAVLQGVPVGLAVGLVTAFVVVGGVALAGAIRFEPKLPVFTLQWMALNLFTTCVFEEALFRGLLQDRLARVLSVRRGGAWVALGVASVLFGLAHAGGGSVLVVAATVAGLGYGGAYMLTGRVEAPVVAHFTLNTIHFLGFTYPMR